MARPPQGERRRSSANLARVARRHRRTSKLEPEHSADSWLPTPRGVVKSVLETVIAAVVLALFNFPGDHGGKTHESPAPIVQYEQPARDEQPARRSPPVSSSSRPNVAGRTVVNGTLALPVVESRPFAVGDSVVGGSDVVGGVIGAGPIGAGSIGASPFRGQ